ncbi:MAG: AGE family epimerase/isomerase [Pseudomonadota bacterium]
MSLLPVILCGGAGTRLWPLSASARPKHAVALVDDTSMLAGTYARLSKGGVHLSIGTPLIVGGERDARMIAADAPQSRLILEPFGRNSAPAVAAAALVTAPDDILLVLPVDHSIADPDAFWEAVAAGMTAAEAGQIVTFGVTPDHPATGYGYIRAATGQAPILSVPDFPVHVFPVSAFHEKPDRETAVRYVSDGNTYWNAGIFLARADVLKAAYADHALKVLTSVDAALPEDRTAPVIYLDGEAFRTCPSRSIDYAIMEHAANVSVVPVTMGWRDIGDFASLRHVLPNNGDGNAVLGDVVALSSAGNLLLSEGPTIATLGVRDLAIVATPRTVLVAPLAEAQNVRAIAGVAGDPDRLRCRPETAARLSKWLSEKALPLWQANGFDPRHGGFAEMLTPDGLPQTVAPRLRLRVQARQVAVFAQAHMAGFRLAGGHGADETLARGLAFMLERCWHPAGGWCRAIGPDGAIADGSLDTYDHAFALYALAWAYRATGERHLLDWIERTVAILDTRMGVGDGTYLEGDPPTLPRRANPHMHLLEAYQAAHLATGETHLLERATQMVVLFERHLFEPETETLTEFLGPSFERLPTPDGTTLEPGHHAEWAFLLAQHESLTGRDLGSHQRRLVRTAERIGANPATGLYWDAVDSAGHVLQRTHRIWPQTERIRAIAHFPGVASARVDDLVDTLFRVYLEPAHPGGWVDRVDEGGAPLGREIPASILYHLMTMIVSLGAVSLTADD